MQFRQDNNYNYRGQIPVVIGKQSSSGNYPCQVAKIDFATIVRSLAKLLARGDKGRSAGQMYP